MLIFPSLVRARARARARRVARRVRIGVADGSAPCAILEKRQVQEGDRKVSRDFVSVAPFLRDMSPDGRDTWWEGQTQTKSQRAH
jgi:hypothetical protein